MFDPDDFDWNDPKIKELKYIIQRTVLVTLQVIAVALFYGLMVEWDYWSSL